MPEISIREILKDLISEAQVCYTRERSEYADVDEKSYDKAILAIAERIEKEKIEDPPTAVGLMHNQAIDYIVKVVKGER